MALIKCPECGKEISNEAKACPHCGKPLAVKHNTAQGNNSDDSKVLFIIIGVILMIVGFFLLYNVGYSIGYGS